MTADVVITGIGTINPIGNSADEFWQSALAGRSGLSFDDEMDLSGLSCGWAGGIVPKERRAEVISRWGTTGGSWGQALTLGSVEQALDDAGLNRSSASIALISSRSEPASGSCPAEYEAYADEAAKLYAASSGEPAAVVEYFTKTGTPRRGGNPEFYQRISERLGGPMQTHRIEATCSGGLRAVVEGARLLQLGHADICVIATGVSRRSPYVASQYSQLTATSSWRGEPRQASMPFDKRRSGMVIAEGSATIVLETKAHARARAAKTYAQIDGWGLAVDTAHPTAPKIELVQRVIETALKRGGVELGDVDVVNAHGTSTRLNDVTEARALHAVFGARMSEIDVCAIKSMTGHASAASGVIEIIASALTLAHGIVPPTPTCTEPDPDCNVQTYLTAKPRNTQVVLKNSFGFGGQYGSLIISNRM